MDDSCLVSMATSVGVTLWWWLS